MFTAALFTRATDETTKMPISGHKQVLWEYPYNGRLHSAIKRNLVPIHASRENLKRYIKSKKATYYINLLM